MIWPVLFRERDITKRVLALQTGRVLERRSNQSKGDHYLRYHLTNQLNLSDEGKPDTFLAVLAVVSYCKRLLTDTPLGKACIHLVGQRIVDQLQRICIRDTRVLPLSFFFSLLVTVSALYVDVFVYTPICMCFPSCFPDPSQSLYFSTNASTCVH